MNELSQPQRPNFPWAAGEGCCTSENHRMPNHLVHDPCLWHHKLVLNNPPTIQSQHCHEQLLAAMPDQAQYLAPCFVLLAFAHVFLTKLKASSARDTDRGRCTPWTEEQAKATVICCLVLFIAHVRSKSVQEGSSAAGMHRVANAPSIPQLFQHG